MTGLGVATGSRRAVRPLERSETSDANLPALGHLSDDAVENGLEGVRGKPAAAKLDLQRGDQFCLVHVFPPEDCRCPATRRASGSSPVTNDGRPTEGRGPSSGATFPLCRNDFGGTKQRGRQEAASREPAQGLADFVVAQPDPTKAGQDEASTGIVTGLCEGRELSKRDTSTSWRIVSPMSSSPSRRRHLV